MVEIGSQADHKKQLDPVLAQRWVVPARWNELMTSDLLSCSTQSPRAHQEKLQTREVPKCVVNDDIGSIAAARLKLLSSAVVS